MTQVRCTRSIYIVTLTITGGYGSRCPTGSIRDFEQMPWLVTRYGKDIAPNDGVLVWVSGKEAGIYAIALLICLELFTHSGT